MTQSISPIEHLYSTFLSKRHRLGEQQLEDHNTCMSLLSFVWPPHVSKISQDEVLQCHYYTEICISYSTTTYHLHWVKAHPIFFLVIVSHTTNFGYSVFPGSFIRNRQHIESALFEDSFSYMQFISTSNRGFPLTVYLHIRFFFFTLLICPQLISTSVSCTLHPDMVLL